MAPHYIRPDSYVIGGLLAANRLQQVFKHGRKRLATLTVDYFLKDHCSLGDSYEIGREVAFAGAAPDVEFLEIVAGLIDAPEAQPATLVVVVGEESAADHLTEFVLTDDAPPSVPVVSAIDIAATLATFEYFEAKEVGHLSLV